MPMDDAQKIELYRLMYLAERWEATLLGLIRQGVLASPYYHAGRGHEGCEVAAVMALRRDDYLFYDHRGCAHILAKGMDPLTLFADFFGNELGSTRGMGAGIVHACDPELGIMGESGTLGRGQLLATGAALSAWIRGTDQVALHFFGDGSANIGTFHEAANVAGAWKLPVVFIVQNNGWAVSVPVEHSTAGGAFAQRGAAYAMPGVSVDGTDPFAVYEAVEQAVIRARAGEGPSLIEARLCRMHGHFEGDPDSYRDRASLDNEARRRDPLPLVRRHLVDLGVLDEVAINGLEHDVRERVRLAAEAASRGRMPGRSRMFEGLYA